MILNEVQNHLSNSKKYIFVNTKIQFLKTGFKPVDNLSWHVDGTIQVPSEICNSLGYNELHDMYARSILKEYPKYISFVTNTNCNTEYLCDPLSLKIPKCVSSFDEINEMVNKSEMKIISQPSCQIIKYDAFSLHRAIPSKCDGWRYWLRVIESNNLRYSQPSTDHNVVFV